MNKLRTGDKVKVVRGKEAGKEGEVVRLITTEVKGQMQVKVVVAGVNKVKRHQKPNPTFGIQGGIIEVEKPIDVSNVMLIDDKGRPSRVGVKVDEKTGKKIRFFKTTGKQIA